MIKPKQHNNFYVITGGPGVGKTTLLNELKKRNYNVVPEVARELIKEQQETNGSALPWKDKNLYKEMMFDLSIQSFQQVSENLKNETPVFFDRGFLDAICYSKLIGLGIDEQMQLYARNLRYNKTVFILPPWQEIYKNDNERKQNWNEAVLTFQQMYRTYQSYGYDAIEIPKTSVSNRADILLSSL